MRQVIQEREVQVPVGVGTGTRNTTVDTIPVCMVNVAASIVSSLNSNRGIPQALRESLKTVIGTIDKMSTFDNATDNYLQYTVYLMVIGDRLKQLQKTYGHTTHIPLINALSHHVERFISMLVEHLGEAAPKRLIPKPKTVKEEVVTDWSPDEALAEAFKQLATNIPAGMQLAYKGGELKVVRARKPRTKEPASS